MARLRVHLSRAVGLALVPAFALSLQAMPVGAGVRSSTEMRPYNVAGTTAASLVAYMRRHPFHGDHGAAVANIRPHYSLSVFTADVARDGLCSVKDIDLGVHFVMTLPHATNPDGMAATTRAAWTSFVTFARIHETTHRGIYLDCANEFVASAMTMTSTESCGALEASIRKALETAKRKCEIRQNAFDRRDYPRVLRLPLFRMTVPPVAKPKH